MLLAALVAALLAAAAPPPPAMPPHEVAGLTIYPVTAPPKMVASYPAPGATIPPGVLVLKLTFDQPMLKTGFDVAPGADGQGPACLKTPRLLNDNKTFVLLCTVEGGKRYALSLNARPDGGFANIGETRAQPTTLAFSTTTEEPVRSLSQAMRLESLGDLDVPVQESPGY